MKLSKHIKELQKILDKHGDLECYYSKDDEGNGFNKVNFEPSVLFKDKNEESEFYIQTFNSIEEMLEWDYYSDPSDAEKIVCIN